MVLMTTKEIPYWLNPIGMVSSFARKQDRAKVWITTRNINIHYIRTVKESRQLRCYKRETRKLKKWARGNL